MDGFERRKEMKKKGILEAALALFSQHGVQKVSIAEIAKKANVSQVTIYNYFGSKEQLTHDTVIYYTVKVWNHYKNEVFNRSMPYIDKMNAIVFDKKEIAANTHKEFYQYIMDVYQKGDYINRLYTEEILPTTMAFLEEGKKLGYVNPSISNEAIMIYIEMYREYFLNKPAEQLLPYTDELIHLFRYGLAGKKES